MKTITRWIIAIVICMQLGLLPAFAMPPMPVTTVTEVLAQADSVGLRVCAGHQEIGTDISAETWRYLQLEEKFILMVFDGEELTWTYFGVIENKDKLVVQQVMTKAQAVEKYQTPCGYFYPTQASQAQTPLPQG